MTRMTGLSGYWQRVRMIRHDAWIIMANGAALGFTWMGVSDSILNLFIVRMGYDPRFVGVVTAVAGLGYALAALPAAAASRQLGTRRAMILGGWGWVAGMAALSLADIVPVPLRPAWILVTRLGAVCALSLSTVSSMPLLAEVTTPEERPHAFALYWSLIPLGAFLGSLVGGLLPGLLANKLDVSLDRSSPYSYTLALGMLLYLPVIWALAFLRAGGPRGRVGPTTASWSRAPYTTLAVVGLVSLLRVGGEFSARTFFNVYMDSALFASAARIGAVMALASLLTIPAPLVTPPVVERIGRTRTVVATTLGLSASVALLALSGHWAVAALAYVGLGALGAMARSVWLLLSQESVEAEWRSTTSAVGNLASGLGVAGMSAVGGYLAVAVGYGSTFLAGAVMIALGAVVCWLCFRAPRPQPADSRGRRAAA
jgi:MFS family permease